METTGERTQRKGKAPSQPAPDILRYMDYRVFLKERLDYLQAVDKKYSQRWVAKRAGFKSPQLLSMIVQGHRNLSRDKVADVSKALKLDDHETEYFQLIVELSECSDHESQKALLDRIQIRFRNGLFASIPDQGTEVFREWYYLAIREIVTLKEAEPTPAWIAERLGISEEEARTGLDLLVNAGFLKPVDKGFERIEPSVHSTGAKVYPIFLAAWHLKMLELAFRAVRLPRDRRYFEGLTFAIPRSRMNEITEVIQRFVREVDMLIESSTDGREEVCHLRVEMFPLTKWVDPCE